ncbi:Serine/Threonine kinase domain protein (macronuclear) [Tetrahymena thermophila SB210]|uniref:non-specific serine/threonine protein kinase n=1 Tax=Tetrahymena thermophila (strain SB210) TaxID=312017 RepID=I7MAV1_TETTS|nr:Serine/Threonine kinase domain protein [Tetrahymena thermophila SB210]EAS06202.3 Serine/Threonine kinase domain protein [Tetrahymena thermophila SB210]|eukprot:XP_001026447.3 Serine/Threonine kinase domain protein [Tetrahymena thermophila SB210]
MKRTNQDTNVSQNRPNLPNLSQQSSTQSQQSNSITDRLKEYEKIREIGRGAYGIVHKVRNKRGQYLAMKEINQTKLNKDKKAHQIYMEKIMKYFKFPGIPELYSCFRDKSQSTIYIVMAYAEGGQFQRIIKKYHQYFTFEVVQFFVAEMVLILEYIHSLGFSHRDFKPENLVLTKDGHLQLIDFGTLNDYCKKLIPQGAIDEVRIKDDYRRQKFEREKIREIKMRQQEAIHNHEMGNADAPNINQTSLNDGILQPSDIEEIEQRLRSQTFCGTAEYLCPEMLEDDVCYMNGDLWALGCIIYKIFTNNTPFVDSQEFLIFNKIKQGIYNKNHEQIPPVANDLISKLLVLDQYERLGSVVVDENITKETVHEAYKKLKSHPFFDGVVWENLYKQRPPEMILQIISGQYDEIKKQLNENQKGPNQGQKNQNDDNNDEDDSEDEDDQEDQEDQAELYIKNQIKMNEQKNLENMRKSAHIPTGYIQENEEKSANQNQVSNSLNGRKTCSEELAQSPSKNKQNQSIGKSDNQNTSYLNVVSSLKPPFTEANLYYQTLINKVNKKLFFIPVKKPRQILLFNTDPIRIIYYIPFRSKLNLKYIVIDENASIKLETPQRIIINDHSDKYVFENIKQDTAQQLYQAILKLQQLKQQQNN